MKISRFLLGLLIIAIAVPGFSGCSDLRRLPSGSSPAAPGRATVEAGNGQVRLSWLAADGAKYYKVRYRFATMSEQDQKIGAQVTWSAGTSMVISGLANGTLYVFTIKGVNENGESPTAVTVSAIPIPEKPAAAQRPAGQLTLSWAAVPGATSYSIYYGTKPGVTRESPTYVKGITATSHTVTGLAPGTAYFFVIASVNAETEGAVSGEISAIARTLQQEP